MDRLSYFAGIKDHTHYPYPEDVKKRLVQRLVMKSEARTSLVWKGDVGHTQRTLPPVRAIYRHWGKTLVRLNKFDSLSEVEDGDWTICWACGFTKGQSLERAHILARCEGGSDEAANLHMLCASCHRASEHLWGREYWDWFMQPFGRSATEDHPSSTLIPAGE